MAQGITGRRLHVSALKHSGSENIYERLLPTVLPATSKDKSKTYTDLT